ncbi:MAG: hypothetical protein SCH71_03895 [Desulfobulbaceae bacterium]|nr:hypothetical protein [Desulfobulbaceae bacterium]
MIVRQCESVVIFNSSQLEDKQMEGILFLVFWLGGAALHTLFDLKIKPVVQAVREESDFS